MQTVVTVGLDIAKNVFQAHGVDAVGSVVFRKRLTRAKVAEFFTGLPACLVGIEACASAHHWARALSELGHTVKLMPPAYVKPYVKSQKNDAADAEAICEAVTRPTMRSDRDLVSREHEGQRRSRRTNRPDTWAHRPPSMIRDFPCQRSAVHTWD